MGARKSETIVLFKTDYVFLLEYTVIDKSLAREKFYGSLDFIQM